VQHITIKINISSLEDAFAKFPSSVPSRCYPKLHRKDYVCPKYFFDILPRPYGFAVQFQLTYTCDRYVIQNNSYTFYIKRIDI